LKSLSRSKPSLSRGIQAKPSRHITSEDKAMDSQLSDAWKRLLTNKAEIELWDGELEERERVNDEAGLRAEVEELRKAEETQREAECE